MSSRSTLKNYFKRGAIPKEADFADLIDSMVIQNEDSVFKPPNDPLSIKAIGANEDLLNFYPADGQSAGPLSWRVQQKPDGKAGLNIADSSRSRLFLESATGNAGLGTTEPKSPLSVAGGLAVGAGYAPANAAPASGLIVEGNVGIGTPTPTTRLQVNAATNSGGSAQLSAPEAVLRLVRDGISGQTWSNVAEFSLSRYEQVGTYARTRLDIGLSHGATSDATAILSVRSDGNIGIGTATPVARLDIQAQTRTDTHPSGINGLYVTGTFGPDSQGVEFRHTNGTQGIGFGYNTIYATGTNANQDLNLKPRGTGYVGIGTSEPRAMLDVNGYIMGRNPYDRNFRDNEAPGGSDSARIKAILAQKPNGTYLIGGPTPNYPYHIFFYWKGNNTYYRTWIPLDRNSVEAF